MDVCLSSRINSPKLFLAHRHVNLPRPNKFNIVSCKASTLCGDGRGRTINFHKLLSVHSNDDAGVDEIKQAYRNMALRYHPDVCDPSKREESTQMFVELHRAYKNLLDLASQKKYSGELGSREKKTRNGLSINNWEGQLLELKRRSDRRKGQKEGTWGNQMRAQVV